MRTAAFSATTGFPPQWAEVVTTAQHSITCSCDMHRLVDTRVQRDAERSKRERQERLAEEALARLATTQTKLEGKESEVRKLKRTVRLCSERATAPQELALSLL